MIFKIYKEQNVKQILKKIIIRNKSCCLYKRNNNIGMSNNSAIAKQINYYLSDQNLAHDEFFYKQIAANKDHFVKLSLFLNCNKIKKLGVSKVQQIVDAVAGDDSLELNADKTMIKRVALDDLPEFKPKKKLKSEEDNHAENPYDKIEPVIFVLGIEKQETVPFKYIQEALLKTHDVFSPYVRFHKSEGHFALDKKNAKPEVVAKLEKEGLKVGNAQLTIKKAEGDDLNQFWEKHGYHYNTILQNLKKGHEKKIKQQKKNAAKNKKVNQFEFGGEKYDDINKLKSLFKNILCRNPNNVPLKENQEKLVKELLSYHDKGAEKLKDLKHFVVDVHPEYPDTRCLFAVKNDLSREDFSIVKCIGKIEEKYSA